MGFLEEMKKQQAKEDIFINRNRSKIGDYDNPKNGCPNCSRNRIMKGDDGKHRCEKCYWCIEDNAYDSEFAEYMK